MGKIYPRQNPRRRCSSTLRRPVEQPGDGGGGDDPQETGQDLTRLLGKILRLHVDVDVPPYYAVPPTNPFVGRTDAPVGDVGQGAWEEIDVQPAARL